MFIESVRARATCNTIISSHPVSSHRPCTSAQLFPLLRSRVSLPFLADFFPPIPVHSLSSLYSLSFFFYTVSSGFPSFSASTLFHTNPVSSCALWILFFLPSPLVPPYSLYFLQLCLFVSTHFHTHVCSFVRQPWLRLSTPYPQSSRRPFNPISSDGGQPAPRAALPFSSLRPARFIHFWQRPKEIETVLEVDYECHFYMTPSSCPFLFSAELFLAIHPLATGTIPLNNTQQDIRGESKADWIFESLQISLQGTRNIETIATRLDILSKDAWNADKLKLKDHREWRLRLSGGPVEEYKSRGTRDISNVTSYRPYRVSIVHDLETFFFFRELSLVFIIFATNVVCLSTVFVTVETFYKN